MSNDEFAPLLQTYWNIPDRQIATSVVLAIPPIRDGAAERLIAAAKAAVCPQAPT